MVSLAFGLALFGLASGSPVGNKSVVLGADCVADWGKCGGKEYDGTANITLNPLPLMMAFQPLCSFLRWV